MSVKLSPARSYAESLEEHLNQQWPVFLKTGFHFQALKLQIKEYIILSLPLDNHGLQLFYLIFLSVCNIGNIYSVYLEPFAMSSWPFIYSLFHKVLLMKLAHRLKNNF